MEWMNGWTSKKKKSLLFQHSRNSLTTTARLSSARHKMNKYINLQQPENQAKREYKREKSLQITH